MNWPRCHPRPARAGQTFTNPSGGALVDFSARALQLLNIFGRPVAGDRRYRVQVSRELCDGPRLGGSYRCASATDPGGR
jgi:hypothetical protein